MTKIYKYGFFLFVINIYFACSTATIEENDGIIFSDIPSGQATISEDKVEDFFNKIQLKDIQLQLKEERVSPLPNARDLYKNALKESVLEFTEKDKRRLNQIFNEIEKSIKKINPNILSKKIKLIKIKPHLYGDGVFYTRDNAIIIPSNMLKDFEKYKIKGIIIHEIFHIYSRNKKESKREALYGLIHFKELKQELNIPEALQQKILLNPDGVEMNWYIETKVESKQLRLIPLLISITSRDGSDLYFDNLELRFYPIFQEGKEIHIKEENYYKEADLSDFYNQITRNTDYITHPDEILADNFVLVVLSQDHPAFLKRLSKEGKILVENLLELLKEND